MKKFIGLGRAAAFVMGLAACGNDEGNGNEGVTDGTMGEVMGEVMAQDVVNDAPPACKATATTKQEACYEMKDTLCERFLSDACQTFASNNECDTWWADNFGDCAGASTDPLPAGLQEGELTTCICNIPTANCAALEDPGFDTAVPACGNALDAMAAN